MEAGSRQLPAFSKIGGKLKMALPEKVQENLMNMFAAAYLAFTDEAKMELGINEFHLTVSKEVENWQVRLREVLVFRGANEVQLAVYDKYMERFGIYRA